MGDLENRQTYTLLRAAGYLRQDANDPTVARFLALYDALAIRAETITTAAGADVAPPSVVPGSPPKVGRCLAGLCPKGPKRRSESLIGRNLHARRRPPCGASAFFQGLTQRALIDLPDWRVSGGPAAWIGADTADAGGDGSPARPSDGEQPMYSLVAHILRWRPRRGDQFAGRGTRVDLPSSIGGISAARG